MKKNKMMRIASVLLVAVLLSTCAISGTFAKYTSVATGTDSARVAKWAFEINDTALTDTFTFDLFKTIQDTDGSAETDMSPVDGTIIAPGTKGSFAIKLENTSEVTAQYAVAFTATNANNIPVQFSLDGSTWKTAISDLDIAAAESTQLAAGTGSATITVYWQWAFNGSDATDTALGTTGTATIEVAAAVTLNQVD